MKNVRAITKFSSLVLLVLSMLVFASPAQAFDGRGGEVVVIPTGEVVADNLYIGAEQFVLDGEVHGDLFVGSRTVVINGRIEGDLFAAAQTITVNGEITGDLRAAGATIYLGPKARVGEDVLALGFSLETAAGNAIERDLLFAGYQSLLAGDLSRNLWLAGAAVDLKGHIGGNAKLEVDIDEDGGTRVIAPWFGPGSVASPSVQPGLTIDPAARIDGSLHYTSRVSASIPSGVVAGPVSHTIPAYDRQTRVEPTPQQVALTWFFDSVRTLVGLLVVGLLLAWIVPAAIQRPAATLAAQPLPSLGWGVLALLVFPFLLIALILLIGVIALVLGALTLGDLLGTILTIGSLLVGGVFAGFGLVLGYLAKLVVAYLIGRWIMRQLRPEWRENVLWAVALGVLIIAIPMSIPVAGGAFGLLLSIFGLGALVILLWNRYRPAPAAVYLPTTGPTA
jgi:cytoskeletal protein CcmA (bactofilin family)